jgi:hypothetical protein
MTYTYTPRQDDVIVWPNGLTMRCEMNGIIVVEGVPADDTLTVEPTIDGTYLIGVVQ